MFMTDCLVRCTGKLEPCALYLENIREAAIERDFLTRREGTNGDPLERVSFCIRERNYNCFQVIITYVPTMASKALNFGMLKLAFDPR